MTREEAIKKLTQLKNKFLDEYIDYDGTTSAYDMAIEALEQPERKKGKWIESKRVCPQFHPDCPDFYSVFICTSCLQANDRKEKYCPHCGAEMEK